MPQLHLCQSSRTADEDFLPLTQNYAQEALIALQKISKSIKDQIQNYAYDFMIMDFITDMVLLCVTVDAAETLWFVVYFLQKAENVIIGQSLSSQGHIKYYNDVLTETWELPISTMTPLATRRRPGSVLKICENEIKKFIVSVYQHLARYKIYDFHHLCTDSMCRPVVLINPICMQGERVNMVYTPKASELRILFAALKT